jgi:apolipoprotein N-acyltransferase
MPMPSRKTIQLFLYSTLTGLLLWASWPDKGITPLIFIALVPLLYVSYYYVKHDVKRAGRKVFGHFYWSMLVWNSLTTWWIYNSTDVGSFVALGLNSLFMACVWQLFYIARKRLGLIAGYFSLIAFWIGFEYLHLNWEISWPWLTLGNVFATHPAYVQWYEFTGVLGGTLWVLATNFFCWALAKNLFMQELARLLRSINSLLLFFVSAILISAPAIFSIWLYKRHVDNVGQPLNVVVVQPNIDPYNEKFSGNSDEQLAKMLRLASSVSDSSTDYIIFPETALPDGIWEEDLPGNRQIKTVESFIKAFPKATVIIGASTFRAYHNNEKPSVTARKYEDAKFYYDVYNTALQIDQRDSIKIYHKTRLVPGVEIMPYPKIFGFLEKFAIDLGGTSGSLGKQDTRDVFVSPAGVKAAPAICYESIYGGFMSGYMRNDAQFIAVITNDGWWKDTPGYRQHMSYARLRAIEFRKSVARAANTGVSCFINQRGDVIEKTSWWKDDVLKQTIYKNDIKTFYARHGDYLGRIFSIIAMVMLASLLIKLLMKRKAA